MNLLQITSVSELKDAENGRNYRVITLNGLPKTHKVGNKEFTIRNTNPARTRCVFDSFVDADGTTFRADELFTDTAVGDILEGSLVTFQTTPYEIDGALRTQWSGAVFGHEIAENYVLRQLNTDRDNPTVSLIVDGELISLTPSTVAELVPQD